MAPYHKQAQPTKHYGFRPEFHELEDILEQERYPEVDKTSENWKPTIERLRRKCSALNNERLMYYGKLQLESERNRDLENILQANISEHEKVVSALAAKVESQSPNTNVDADLDLKQKLEERIKSLENELAGVKAAKKSHRQKHKIETQSSEPVKPLKNNSNDIERVLKSISDLKDQLESRIEQLTIRQQKLDERQPVHPIRSEFGSPVQSKHQSRMEYQFSRPAEPVGPEYHSQAQEFQPQPQYQSVYQHSRLAKPDYHPQVQPFQPDVYDSPRFAHHEHEPQVQSIHRPQPQPAYQSPQPAQTEFQHHSQPQTRPTYHSPQFTAAQPENQPQYQPQSQHQPQVPQHQAQRPQAQQAFQTTYLPQSGVSEHQAQATQPEVQPQSHPIKPTDTQPDEDRHTSQSSQSQAPAEPHAAKSEDPLIPILLQEIITSNKSLHSQISQLSQTQNAHYNELSEKIRHQSEESNRQNAHHDLRFAKLEEIIAHRFAEYDTKVKQQQQQQQQQFTETPRFNHSIATPPSSRGYNSVASPKPMQRSSLNDSRSSTDYTTTGSAHSTVSTSTPNHNNSRPHDVEINLNTPPQDPYSVRIQALYDRLKNGELSESDINRYETIYDKSDQILRERPQLMSDTKNLVNDLKDHLPKKHLPLITAVREDLV